MSVFDDVCADLDRTVARAERLEAELTAAKEALNEAQHIASVEKGMRKESDASLAVITAERNTACFLIVAMDDDGCGTPIYCKDESSVRDALRSLMFSGESLNEEHERELDAQAELCIKEGGLSFEGDPSIDLYKLAAIDVTRGKG
jgi:hypothetical protein